MSTAESTIHLVTLKQDVTNDVLLSHLTSTTAGEATYLIKGRTHGWVHRPHRPAQRRQLLAHDWDAFFLTHEPSLPGTVSEVVSAHLSVRATVPKAQLDEIQSQIGIMPEPMSATPPLPSEWPKSGGIPASATTSANEAALKPGELRLDPPMVDFLSNALPAEVANAPLCFFNLFKYPNGNSSVHDHYMEGFKNNFGDAAGAAVKFMGPVNSAITYENHESTADDNDAAPQEADKAWEDANLVQYDSIWHYAYMLSTDIYQELNKEKIAGLEDTCILLVSEVELAR